MTSSNHSPRPPHAEKDRATPVKGKPLAPKRGGWRSQRLTARGGEEAERKLQTVLAEVETALSEALPAEAVRAVVLLGGYGRGEGGVTVVNGEERPHNNLDLLVISQDKAHGPLGDRARNALSHIEREHGIDVDVGSISEQRLKSAPCMVMWYDMRHGHRTILGDETFVPGLTRFTREQVLPWDVRNLMVNRGTLLLINELLLARGPVDDANRRTIVKHVMKALIGYGDALLFAAGQYDWSYEEKGLRMTVMKSAPESLRKLYHEAIEFRFRPDYAAYQSRDLVSWHSELRPVVADAHLAFERYRLKAPRLTWSTYARAAFRSDLMERDVGLRALRKVKNAASALREGGASRLPLLQSRDPRSLAGFLSAGMQGSLPIVFPLIQYDEVPEAARALPARVLGVSEGDRTALKKAYLGHWLQLGDPNSRWGELV